MSQAETTDTAWILACPRCRETFDEADLTSGVARCRSCQLEFAREAGVWRFLPPDRAEFYEPFLRDYTMIRHQEGRGSTEPEFFRALPECDPAHPVAWQWQFHQRTLAALHGEVVPPRGPSLSILDLGAGLGWLSHRLAEHGHRVAAVDITVDDQDGLGAIRHYDAGWPALQAEFDALPLADGQADLVIYNASLHYSTDYATTLREGLRVLRDSGRLVIVESPVYRLAKSGEQMVAERHASFEKRYGTRSDTIASREFLTWQQIDELCQELGLRSTVKSVWYGWRMAWRPWKARLRKRREPASFPMVIMARSASH